MVISMTVDNAIDLSMTTLLQNKLLQWFFAFVLLCISEKDFPNFFPIIRPVILQNITKVFTKYYNFTVIYNLCSRKSKMIYSQVQSCKFYNSKFIITLTQITKTQTFVFIAVVILKLLSCNILFINRKDNRNY